MTDDFYRNDDMTLLESSLERVEAVKGTCLPSSRRSFLTSAVAGTAGLGLLPLFGSCNQGRVPGHGIAPLYDGLKGGEFFDGEMRIETRVNDERNFTEGPAVDQEGNVFFTNIPVSKIYKWNPGTQQLTVFREKSHKTNGLMFDAQGRLLVCEGESGRVTRTDMESGEITILASEFDGHPLEGPNDLDIDKEGRIYFSSRPSSDAPSKGYLDAVYRIDPDGGLHQVLRDPQVQMPNGIVVTPDSRSVYLIEAHPDAGHNRRLSRFDLSPDGTFSDQQVLIDFYPGRSGDGMCIDSAGNLYVAAGLHKRRGTSETLDTRPGIHVFSSQGELLDYIATPEDTITNCTFGGTDRRTLYITSGALLLSIRTRIKGASAKWAEGASSGEAA